MLTASEENKTAICQTDMSAIAVRFCLSCGCLRLDWIGWAYRCQACGELELPPEVLCCWCRATFRPEEIEEHRAACSRLNWSADTSVAWAKKYEWPEDMRRMFTERPVPEFRAERA